MKELGSFWESFDELKRYHTIIIIIILNATNKRKGWTLVKKSRKGYNAIKKKS